MKQLLLIVLITLTINGYSQVPPYVSTTALVAWYPFTGNAADSSGSGTSCIVTGPVLTTDRFGHTNSAYRFNGSTDYMTAPQQFSTGANSKSFSVWFKVDTLKRGWIIAGGLDAFPSEAFGLYFQDTAGTITFHGEGAYDVILDTLNDTSLWHHVAVTYSLDTIKSYIDGVFKVAHVEHLATSPTSIIFGRRQNASLEGGHDAYFCGKIDDIGVWSRPLTYCEVIELYRDTTSCDTSTISLSVKNCRHNEVTVSPNPTDNRVFINSTSLVEKVEVLNMLGQSVLNEMPYSNSLQLDLADLPKGVYILLVNGSYAVKIVKGYW